MADFVPFRIQVDSQILQLLEAISRRQGELSAHQRNIRDDVEIESIAAIDAVHFSTKIEGNTLTRDQVTEALQSRRAKATTRDLYEVLNYSQARRMVREWSAMGKQFNDEWVLEHHAALLKGIVRGKLRGHYRDAQCVIKDSGSRAIVYMAPESKDVSELMHRLLLWLRQQKTTGASPLLLAAQFHFEFVTIHPFMDGNGRLARLLSNGILLAGNYDVERYAALEKQHERDRTSYYKALRTLQSGNYYDIPQGRGIRSWVSYWLKCLLATYDEALTRISGARPASAGELSGGLENRVSKAESLFKRHKKLKASEYSDLMGLARTQAVADLNELVRLGILERVGGGRSTVYRIIVMKGAK